MQPRPAIVYHVGQRWGSRRATHATGNSVRPEVALLGQLFGPEMHKACEQEHESCVYHCFAADQLMKLRATVARIIGIGEDARVVRRTKRSSACLKSCREQAAARVVRPQCMYAAPVAGVAPLCNRAHLLINARIAEAVVVCGTPNARLRSTFDLL